MVIHMNLNEFDLDKEKIGVVVPGDPSKHLHRLTMMKLIIGERRSAIEIYGEVTNQGRPRIRRESHLNQSFARQAREYALKWKILRKNIEVHYENAEA